MTKRIMCLYMHHMYRHTRITKYIMHVNAGIINPRRACAARVTIVVLRVCLSVCLQLFSHYRLQGGYEQLQCYKGMKTNVGILLKRLHWRDMA